MKDSHTHISHSLTHNDTIAIRWNWIDINSTNDNWKLEALLEHFGWETKEEENASWIAWMLVSTNDE